MSWMRCATPGPWTPPAYDAEVDPDPTVEDLERDIDRLEQALARWGRHAHDCPARFGSFMGLRFSDPTSCRCGLREATDGTLWEGTDDANLGAALERLDLDEDEEVSG